MPKIYIPTPLRPYTGKLDTVEVKAGTVNEALTALTSAHPDLKKLLYSDEGKLRSYVKVYLNDDDVRHLDAKEQTAMKESDSLSIIQSVAGGCR
jgi:molybdopterin converting factor small subunit